MAFDIPVLRFNSKQVYTRHDVPLWLRTCVLATVDYDRLIVGKKITAEEVVEPVYAAPMFSYIRIFGKKKSG